MATKDIEIKGKEELKWFNVMEGLKRDIEIAKDTVSVSEVFLKAAKKNHRIAKRKFWKK